MNYLDNNSNIKSKFCIQTPYNSKGFSLQYKYLSYNNITHTYKCQCNFFGSDKKIIRKNNRQSFLDCLKLVLINKIYDIFEKPANKLLIEFSPECVKVIQIILSSNFLHKNVWSSVTLVPSISIDK